METEREGERKLYKKKEKPFFFFTLQRNCVEFTTSQEAIKNYWAENRTEENGLPCQNWYSELERKLFPNNLCFYPLAMSLFMCKT